MKIKNGTIAQQLIPFLQSRVGSTLHIDEILSQAGFKPEQKHGLRQALERLCKLGELKKTKPGTYRIATKILNGKTKANGKAASTKQSDIQLPMITPQAQSLLDRVHDIQNAQPIDLDSILQAQADATRHVILVEQQNRLLNSALDQIIRILEQCGKIEVK